MPAFAFVAGFVYALRPVKVDQLPSFIAGKLQRLAVPGVIAVLLFSLVSSVLHLRAAVPIDQLWQVLIFPYMHYWFLQSMLALFVIIGTIDSFTDRRAEIPLLALAMALYLARVPAPDFFSLNGAVHLAPFFLIGVSYIRHRRWFDMHAPQITVSSLALILIWCAWTIIDYSHRGSIDTGHREVQAIIFAMPSCALLLFYLPNMPGARSLGRFSFTIYLYHAFGVAGVRILLYKLGFTSLPVHLVAGLAAGVSLPVAIHLFAMRSAMMSRIVLGIRAPRPVFKPITQAPLRAPSLTH